MTRVSLLEDKKVQTINEIIARLHNTIVYEHTIKAAVDELELHRLFFKSAVVDNNLLTVIQNAIDGLSTPSVNTFKTAANQLTTHLRIFEDIALMLDEFKAHEETNYEA